MDTENRALFASRLREERDRLGLSQADIAERCGAKPRTYQDWERAVAPVSVEFLSTALTAVGLDAVYVLTGIRTPPDHLPVRMSNGAAVINEDRAPRYLTPEQESLLDNYNAADERGRAAARSVLGALAHPKASNG